MIRSQFCPRPTLPPGTVSADISGLVSSSTVSTVSVNDRVDGYLIWNTSLSGIVQSSTEQYKELGQNNFVGIHLEIQGKGIIAETNPNNIDWIINVTNDGYDPNYPGHFVDIIGFYSFGNKISEVTGLQVNEVYWVLEDPFGTAISSSAIPTSCPNIVDWNNPTKINISMSNDGSTILINVDNYYNTQSNVCNSTTTGSTGSTGMQTTTSATTGINRTTTSSTVVSGTTSSNTGGTTGKQNTQTETSIMQTTQSHGEVSSAFRIMYYKLLSFLLVLLQILQ